jgi:hypothetical protein
MARRVWHARRWMLAASSAAGAGPATETAPGGSSAPVATEDADTPTSTTPTSEEKADARSDMGEARASAPSVREDEHMIAMLAGRAGRASTHP